MTSLPDTELRTIALEEARAGGFGPFADVSVTPTVDPWGDPALDVVIEGVTSTDYRQLALAMLKAARSMYGRLLALGDDRYPYIRFGQPEH